MAIEEPVLLPRETHVVSKPLDRSECAVFESFISEGCVSRAGVAEL